MEGKICKKCLKISKKYINPACSHTLCMECVAEVYVDVSLTKEIKCRVCHQTIQLNMEEFNEINKIVEKLENRKQDQIEIRKKNLIENKANRFEKGPLLVYPNRARRQNRNSLTQRRAGSSNSLASSMTTSQSLLNVYHCTDHPQEQLIYYCFDCNSGCICPQCIIHGPHNGHQSKTIKKSKPIIKDRLQNLRDNLNINILKLLNKKNEYQQYIVDIKNQNNLNKAQIHDKFTQLQQKIFHIEEQILNNCDITLNINIQMYEKEIKELMQKIQDTKDWSQKIFEALKKEDLHLLNFYAKCNLELESVIKKIQVEGYCISPQKPQKNVYNNSIIDCLQKIYLEISKLDNIQLSFKQNKKIDHTEVDNQSRQSQRKLNDENGNIVSSIFSSKAVHFFNQ